MERYLNLRYRGTDVAMMILQASTSFSESFRNRYTKEFGFVLDREVLIDDMRVRACGKAKMFESIQPSERSSGNGFIALLI